MQQPVFLHADIAKRVRGQEPRKGQDQVHNRDAAEDAGGDSG